MSILDKFKFGSGRSPYSPTTTNTSRFASKPSVPSNEGGSSTFSSNLPPVGNLLAPNHNHIDGSPRKLDLTA